MRRVGKRIIMFCGRVYKTWSTWGQCGMCRSKVRTIKPIYVVSHWKYSAMDFWTWFQDVRKRSRAEKLLVDSYTAQGLQDVLEVMPIEIEKALQQKYHLFTVYPSTGAMAICYLLETYPHARCVAFALFLLVFSCKSLSCVYRISNGSEVQGTVSVHTLNRFDCINLHWWSPC